MDLAAPDALKVGRECNARGGAISASIRDNLAWAAVADAGQKHWMVAPPAHYMAPCCPRMQAGKPVSTGRRRCCTSKTGSR